MWQSEIVLGQGRWEIHIPLKRHESRDEAEHFAQYGVEDPSLAIRGDDYTISVNSGDTQLYFTSSELVIYEISPEKESAIQQSCAELASAHRERILDLLKPGRATSRLDPADRAESRYELEDFFVAYGVGASLNIIDWAVKEVKP